MSKDTEWRWSKTPNYNSGKALGVLKSLEIPYAAEIPPFCYPGTILDSEVGEIARSLIVKQINMIGSHTHRREGEGGFEGPQRMEAETIWMIASMVGGNPDTVDGYFGSGGTEANQVGLWIGREWLRRPGQHLNRSDIVVLATPLVHYSVIKATEILDMGKHPEMSYCSKCSKQHIYNPDPIGAGVVMVGINKRGEMDVADLKRVIRLKQKEGFSRFIVVLTAGTCVMGSIDPICQVNDYVRHLHETTDIRVYVHVDASFGGFTIPFVAPHMHIGFENSEVCSMALDADKMGHLPYPAGVFLCRKDLQDLIALKVGYIRGHQDDTLCGSRSALAPLIGWYLYQKLGVEGQRAYVQTCLEHRDRLADMIAERFPQDGNPRVRLMPFSPWVNFLPLEIDIKDGEVPHEMLEDPNGLGPFHLRSDFFPCDPNNTGCCPKKVYKICIMPHTFSYLQTFVDRLAEAVGM